MADQKNIDDATKKAADQLALDMAKSEADKKVLEAKAAEKKATDLAKEVADKKIIDDAAK